MSSAQKVAFLMGAAFCSWIVITVIVVAITKQFS